MTRSDQSPDPLNEQVCCSAILSANCQLFETYNLVEKGDVLDSIDDDDDIEWLENSFDYREDKNTETIIYHDSFRRFCWIPSEAEGAL